MRWGIVQFTVMWKLVTWLGIVPYKCTLSISTLTVSEGVRERWRWKCYKVTVMLLNHLPDLVSVNSEWGGWEGFLKTLRAHRYCCRCLTLTGVGPCDFLTVAILITCSTVTKTTQQCSVGLQCTSVDVSEDLGWLTGSRTAFMLPYPAVPCSLTRIDHHWYGHPGTL